MVNKAGPTEDSKDPRAMPGEEERSENMDAGAETVVDDELRDMGQARDGKPAQAAASRPGEITQIRSGRLYEGPAASP